MVIYDKISVKPDTKKLFKDCYKEFLKQHPDYEDVLLSEDFMIRRICRYYLDMENE
jgi:hypothetical protein